MTPVLQILLYISYAVIGFSIAIFLPEFSGLNQNITTGMGVLFYVTATQTTRLYWSDRDHEITFDKIEDLERQLFKTRSELTNLAEKMDMQGDNSKVTKELKMLQTLLMQFVQKEKQITKKSAPVQKVTSQKKSTPPLSKAAEDQKSSMSERARELEQIAKTRAAEQQKPQKPKNNSDIPDLDSVLTADPKLIDAGTTTLDEEEEIIELSESEIFDDELSGGKGDERRRLETPGLIDDLDSDTKDDAPENTRKKRTFKKRKIRLIKKESQLLDVMRSGLSENRVDLYLQPIVGLPARKAIFFECFSRVRDEEGNIILPRHYMKLAEQAGLSGTLDNLLLFRLIQLIRKMGQRKSSLKFFTNLSLASLVDKEFFPQFVDYMTMNEEFSNRLVFEIAKNDYDQLPDNVLDMMSTMGNKGFAFSLDHVDSIDLDLEDLSSKHIRYVKIDHKILETSFEETQLRDYVMDLRMKEIALISSRVEREAMVLHALDNEIEFAQGYLFSEPVAASEMDQIL